MRSPGSILPLARPREHAARFRPGVLRRSTDYFLDTLFDLCRAGCRAPRNGKIARAAVPTAEETEETEEVAKAATKSEASAQARKPMRRIAKETSSAPMQKPVTSGATGAPIDANPLVPGCMANRTTVAAECKSHQAALTLSTSSTL